MLAEFKQWLSKRDNDVLPKSLLGEAKSSCGMFTLIETAKQTALFRLS